MNVKNIIIRSTILSSILLNLSFPTFSLEKTNIGIIPLSYSEQESIKSYSLGTQDTLISALNQIPELVIVDRTKTNEILKELNFQQSVYVDQETTVKLGKLLGVRYLLSGSIQKVGSKIRIQIQQLDVETGQTRAVGKVTGELDDLFELQDKLSNQILNSFGIELTDNQSQKVTSSIKVTKNIQAYAYYSKGNFELDKENYNEAISQYNEALKLDPNFEDALTSRGAAYIKLKDFGNASSDLNKSILIDPESYTAYSNLGLLYLEKKELYKAIEYFDKSISLYEKNPIPFYNRGTCYLGLGTYDLAIPDLEKAISIRSEYKNARINLSLSYFNRAAGYYNSSNFESTAIDLERALIVYPNIEFEFENAKNIKELLVKSYYFQAIGFLEKREYLKVLDLTDKMLIHSQNDPAAFLLKANIFLEQNEPNKALETLSLSIKYNPKHAESYFYRGFINMQRLNFEQALSDANQATKLNPNFDKAYLLKGLLNKMGKNCVQANKDFNKACSLGIQEACQTTCP